jgi:hypothetical protein
LKGKGIADHGIEDDNSLKVSLAILLAGVVVSMVILAWIPPISRDALIHHLALPKLYLEHGGVYEIPFMEFSYYPMNLDLLFLIPLYFGLDIVPKFLHMAFAFLTAWMIFRYLKPRIGPIFGLFGVVFFLSLPIVLRLSTTAYVDMGLVFFTTASLLWLLKWFRNPFTSKALIISGIFCGLALGTKYNGLVTLLGLTCTIPLFYRKYVPGENIRPLSTLRYAVLFASIAFILFLPWLTKNFVWTGNPIYPLFDQYFSSERQVGKGAVSFLAFRAYLYNETWWDLALLPVRIFFQGQDGSPQYFDGRLSPFLLFLPILAFILPMDDDEAFKQDKRIFLLFALFFFAFTFFSGRLRIRYISPMIPPLIVLSSLGLKTLTDRIGRLEWVRRRRLGSAFAFLMIVAVLIPNSIYAIERFRILKPWGYISGRQSRDAYIEAHRPEYASFQYINRYLPLQTKILFMFMGNRGYYCDRPYFFDMKGNRSILGQIVRDAETPDEIRTALQRRGVTHLLLNHKIFYRWLTESFDERNLLLVDRFFRRHTPLVFSKHGYRLYALLDNETGLEYREDRRSGNFFDDHGDE